MHRGFKRILILDDDSFHNTYFVLLIKNFFQDRNMDIVGFTNPEEGLAYIEAEYAARPVQTVFFLDINMPVLNGWDVLDKLSQMPATILNCFTIYILSSSLEPGEIKKAKENKLVRDYLEKPLSNHMKFIFPD